MASLLLFVLQIYTFFYNPENFLTLKSIFIEIYLFFNDNIGIEFFNEIIEVNEIIFLEIGSIAIIGIIFFFIYRGYRGYRDYFFESGISG